MNSAFDNQPILQVANLLVQIQDVNCMIKIHQDGEDNFMLTQYQYCKNKLTKALAEMLDSFDVNFKDWAA